MKQIELKLVPNEDEGVWYFSGPAARRAGLNVVEDEKKDRDGYTEDQADDFDLDQYFDIPNRATAAYLIFSATRLDKNDYAVCLAPESGRLYFLGVPDSSMYGNLDFEYDSFCSTGIQVLEDLADALGLEKGDPFYISCEYE